jgi:hypothetical protein
MPPVTFLHKLFAMIAGEDHERVITHLMAATARAVPDSYPGMHRLT